MAHAARTHAVTYRLALTHWKYLPVSVGDDTSSACSEALTAACQCLRVSGTHAARMHAVTYRIGTSGALAAVCQCRLVGNMLPGHDPKHDVTHRLALRHWQCLPVSVVDDTSSARSEALTAACQCLRVSGTHAARMHAATYRIGTSGALAAACQYLRASDTLSKGMLYRHVLLTVTPPSSSRLGGVHG